MDKRPSPPPSEWGEPGGDPRLLDFDTPCYISGGPQADYLCRVDEEDYPFLIQFVWQVTHYPRFPKLKYLRRNYGGRNYYLHRIVQLRKQVLPPTRKHVLVDHINGDTLDCRRANLRWATPRENRHNYNGFAHAQRELRLDALWDVAGY